MWKCAAQLYDRITPRATDDDGIWGNNYKITTMGEKVQYFHPYSIELCLQPNCVEP